MVDCLFCDRANTIQHHIILENDKAYVRWDNMPVNQGHLEIVPKRHIVSFFELTERELVSIYELTAQAKDVVDKKYSPSGYNIGVNEGEAAGRTIHHLHVHLIPRYLGDVTNPRGGVRHVVPDKGNY
jgi:diadenosine tetraphosphate (Ap4A) HIT family hydrolase